MSKGFPSNREGGMATNGRAQGIPVSRVHEGWGLGLNGWDIDIEYIVGAIRSLLSKVKPYCLPCRPILWTRASHLIDEFY